MRKTNIDQGWKFLPGMFNLTNEITGQARSREVNLPHDFMLESEVTKDAPAGPAMGYYNGGVGSYTKFLDIPYAWKDDKVFLHFDGVMMNAAVEVNGSQAALHHYGYTPFVVDITHLVNFGEQNRVTVTVNASMQPNSRWYTGAGIYRSVELVHTPKLHIAADGIFTYTKRIEYENETPTEAFLAAEVTIVNETQEDHIVKVDAILSPDRGQAATFCNGDSPESTIVVRSASILVKAGNEAQALIPITVKNPRLWDAMHPDLYEVTARVTDQGVFRTSLIPVSGEAMTDSDSVLFGIRTVTADSTHGLLVNGRPVKLKGGCIHHDNGVLGAVSLYDSEYRKLKLHKESGYNAVRTAHNPPSAALLAACDRLGLYVFDEAFDAWGMAKQPGDYNQFFRGHWKEDMRSFILRDRNHPSILFWSTGNEIPERGGLGDGYSLAAQLAEYVRSLDSTRLVSNAMCSYWSGLDDNTLRDNLSALIKSVTDGGEAAQNAPDSLENTYWEERSEAFLSCLDAVGYNYAQDRYEIAGRLYPERVIVGTESFPMEIDQVWELVEKLPYVIGDFTWTSYDYIGEAGIGKSIFLNPDDPMCKQGPHALMSHTSQYPWRLANDADFDINGALTPQGSYRKIVWGSAETFLYSYDPASYGKTELISKWGWPDVRSCWNWTGMEGRPVQVVVYSASEETELFLNGTSQGRKPAGRACRFTAAFDITYQPGTLEAVSYDNGMEVSRCRLSTTGAPSALRLRVDLEHMPQICNTASPAADCGAADSSPAYASRTAGSVPAADSRTADSALAADKGSTSYAVLNSDGSSLAYIAVEIVDNAGNVVSDASVLLSAEVTGAATLAGFGSSNPVTDENYTAGKFTSYHGRAMAVIRSGYESGIATLTVRADGMEEQSISLNVK